MDTYGTVQPHTLIRQHLDYTHWYDRAKLSLKEVHNCQYVACMNPTAGSFTINPRLQVCSYWDLKCLVSILDQIKYVKMLERKVVLLGQLKLNARRFKMKYGFKH